MVKKLKIGICGTGQFAGSFIPLFKAHPMVEEVYIAEVFPERRQKEAKRFGIRQVYASLDELIRSDADAVVLMTQRWMHAPQAIKALKAGKHVYSAVPAATTLEELSELVETVKATGLTYMMGETSYYYPATLYCRKRFAAGDFGQFVYGEGEYLHDMSVGFYEAYQYSGGENWKSTASYPPMLYPTHSISMILSVTGSRMTEVSCMGYVDRHDDGVFRAEVSMWGNIFSNETALFRTADGGMCRINEFRRVGYRAHPEVRMSLFGTEANFEEQTCGRVWNTRSGETQDLTDLLTCKPPAQMDPAEYEHIAPELRAGFFTGLSAVHPVERLPKEFIGLPNGHEGSHQFLVLDFIEAILNETLPPVNVWEAARYNAPGMVAHESAKRGGELLKIPDFGDAPKT